MGGRILKIDTLSFAIISEINLKYSSKGNSLLTMDFVSPLFCIDSSWAVENGITFWGKWDFGIKLLTVSVSRLSSPCPFSTYAAGCLFQQAAILSSQIMHFGGTNSAPQNADISPMVCRSANPLLKEVRLYTKKSTLNLEIHTKRRETNLCTPRVVYYLKAVIA